MRRKMKKRIRVIIHQDVMKNKLHLSSTLAPVWRRKMLEVVFIEFFNM